MQLLGEVVFMLDACRQFWGTTVQKTVEFPQLQCAVMVVDVPVHAVHRRLWMSLCLCGDSGALAGGPLTQFIAGVGGLSSFRDGVSTRVDGDAGVGAHHTGDVLK